MLNVNVNNLLYCFLPFLKIPVSCSPPSPLLLPSVWLSVCHCVSLFLYMSVSLSVPMSLWFFVCLYVYFFVCVYVYLLSVSLCLFISLTITLCRFAFCRCFTDSLSILFVLRYILRFANFEQLSLYSTAYQNQLFDGSYTLLL